MLMVVVVLFLHCAGYKLSRDCHNYSSTTFVGMPSIGFETWDEQIGDPHAQYTLNIQTLHLTALKLTLKHEGGAQVSSL